MKGLWISRKRYLRELRRTEIERVFQLLQSFIPIVERKSHISRNEIDQLADLMKRITRHFPEQKIADWEIYLVSHLLFASRIKIPDYIYAKSEKISPYEASTINEHILFANELLHHDPIFTSVKEAFTHHHTRVDGHGSPSRLEGEQIPFFARVIHVAESYVSLTSPRSYRDAYTPSEALCVLKEDAGSIYDQRIVDILELELGLTINLNEDLGQNDQYQLREIS